LRADFDLILQLRLQVKLDCFKEVAAVVRSFRNLSILLLLALGLLGCRPSVKEVSANVKSSMQQTFDSDPQFRGLHLIVSTVTLVRDHDNSFQGMATVISARQSHDISITVTADGTNTIWKSEPGALLPLMLDSLQNENPYSLPSNSGEESSTDRALRLIKRDYRLKTDQPEESQHGVWTTSVKTEGNPNFVEINVNYSVSESGMNCRWIVSFPLSAPSTYSEIPVDGCAKEQFFEVPVSPR
jgi:hypothetical protein